MSSMCDLYVADYPIISTKKYPEVEAMTIFSERDKKKFTRCFNQRNKIQWAHAISESKNELETAIEYQTTVHVVKSRLDAMGFSLKKAITDFESTKLNQINEYKDYAGLNDDYNLYEKEIELLRTNDYAKYMDAIKEILKSSTHPAYYLDKNSNHTDLVKYLLEYDDICDNFPVTDIRFFIRLVIETCNDDDKVIYDLTDVVNAGYYELENQISDMARSQLTRNYSTNSKIIVLTEGKTDAEILRKSIELLYPYMCHLYAFTNFDFKVPAGTGNLVNTLKSFAGAGIENRIIAIFDNDTAAYEATDNLKKINLPNNIKFTHYPNIDIAADYPTLGPNGLISMDVNGMSCSIELYLGCDVLKQDDGNLYPIQWTGYCAKLERYQGEIVNKDDIKNKFMNKINSISDNNSLNKDEWLELREIFKHIFSIFQEQ